jgi:hypothetical protein
MQIEHFKDWLRINTTYPEHTISTTISCCIRVEKYYGDLDKIIAECGEEWLIQELNYTTKNERDNVEPKIKIGGRVITGYASLKKAVKLYFKMYQI